MPGKSKRGFTRPIRRYLEAEGDMEGKGKEDHEDIPVLEYRQFAILFPKQ